MATDNQFTESARASAHAKVVAMGTWQKSIIRMSLPVRWIAGGATVGLLALGGLWVLAPMIYAPPQPKFFISLFLHLVFEIGLVAFIIALNCWLNLKLAHREPAVGEFSAARSNPILAWPGQEMAGNEQYA